MQNIPLSEQSQGAWYKRLDVLAVAFLFLVIAIVRVTTITPNELSWDVFGYYLYLPATFIHHDPLLHDIGWVREVQQQYGTTGTLYQISDAPDGSPIYFFLMGTAVLHAPFFVLGHVWAKVTGAPADGFSMPYQVSIALGCLVYTLIGLLTLRKVLRHYFSAGVTAAVVLIIGLGTNYFHLNTVKNEETANLLFMGLALMVWCTIRWHATEKRKYLLAVAACLGMLTLIKPSEITFGLVPLCWGVYDRASFQAKLDLLRRKWLDVVLGGLVAVLILSPQLMLWKVKTGSFLFDSYVNPGVGLDWWRPHVWPLLFDFRGGWLIYTPVMWFTLAGLAFFFRRRLPMAFWSVLLAFGASFFIIASWTEWWHGGSFSSRPMATNYAILALPLACTLERMARARTAVRMAGGGVLVALMALNLFQIWQHQHYILVHTRVTAPYYFAVFGRTSVPEGAKALLRVERTFDGNEHLTDSAAYDRHSLGTLDLSEMGEHVVEDTLLHARVLRLDDGLPYSPAIERSFGEVTSGDHFWARARVRMMIPQEHEGDMPCLVMTMERPAGTYGYRAFCVPDTVPRGTWFELKGEYLTPEIREGSDRFKTYVWYRGKGGAYMDGLRVTTFTPR